MDERRRDKKGRLLRNGETQNKKGRYRYTYFDHGKRVDIYSWRLVVTDPLPPGKRECIPLREQEDYLRKRQLLEPSTVRNQQTVLSLVLWYTENRKGVRETTRSGYKTVLRMLQNDPFGERMIDSIKAAEAKEWLSGLQVLKGYSYNSIHTIRGVVRGAFKEAVFHGWLSANPFNEFSLKDAIEDDTNRRDAIDEETQKRLMDFIAEDKHFSMYYEGFYILLHTGMRISEFCGLTFDDVDLEKREIRIDHQLMRVGVNVYCEPNAKTKAGVRTIPITDDVCMAFRKLIARRRKPEKEPEVDGCKGFLSLDKDGHPTLAMHWEHRLTQIRKKYNSHYEKPLPKITPHVLRHTYCTRQALAGMNPKILQYLMGHSDITITLGYYTHAKCDDARAELDRMEAMRQTPAQTTAYSERNLTLVKRDREGSAVTNAFMENAVKNAVRETVVN